MSEDQVKEIFNKLSNHLQAKINLTFQMMSDSFSAEMQRALNIVQNDILKSLSAEEQKGDKECQEF